MTPTRIENAGNVILSARDSTEKSSCAVHNSDNSGILEHLRVYPRETLRF